MGMAPYFFVFRNLTVTLHFPADMGMDLETWYDGNCQMFLTVGCIYPTAGGRMEKIWNTIT